MEQIKLGRNYRLIIQIEGGETITVKPPFTLEFNAIRDTLSDANVGDFRIYNLGADARALIRKDEDDSTVRKTVIFRAGYGENMSQAFIGNISKAWSIREGVDFVTNINAFDGGAALVNVTLDVAFPKGSPQRSIIRSMISKLQEQGVKPGAIGQYLGKSLRGNSFTGPVAQTLSDLTGDGFFIDNNKANVLKDKEVLDVPIYKIDSSTGLLGTPTRQRRYVDLEMLFEPQIVVGQMVRLDSSTIESNFNKNDPGFDGIYKVLSVAHQGIISEAVAGKATTTLGMIPGSFIPVKQESE